ncbi:MAG TPA: VOC family protein [Opitutaceae bacterium]|nr:VOC family protein [Opitutaceae bacterium]
MRPPPLTSVVESILYVSDLARTAEFYRQVMLLETVGGDARRFAAFALGPGQVLLLFVRGATTTTVAVPGGLIPPHEGDGPQHIGFGITADAYEPWRAHLVAHGVAIESETHWPAGGRSLYFRDPDQHLVELITPGIWPNY